MWRKYFFLVLRTRDGTIFEVGGAEVCKIAAMGYLPGTPKEDAEMRSTEWFYMEDVPLEDPIRQGLPLFSLLPLRKQYNWHPEELLPR